MSDVFADARAVDFGALGTAMSAMRGGFAEAGPTRFAHVAEPKHFSPANPGTNPTAGWDPFEAASDPAIEPDAGLVAVEAARAEGFAEGMAAAERIAAARGEADMQALARIADGLNGFDREALGERLRLTVMALVTRLVGEAGVSGDLLARRIGAAVDLIAESSEAGTLRLHPDDAALIDGHVPDRLTVTPDPAIERGGFRIETRSSSVEDGPAAWLAQLTAAMDRVAMPAGQC